MRPTQLFAAVVAVSSVTSALSGAFDNVHGLAGVKDILMGRQDNQQDASSQAPQSNAPKTTDRPTDKPTPTQSGDNNNNNNDNNSDKDQSTQSGKTTGSAKASGSQGTKTTGKPKTTSFDPRLPAGGISMVTPNALAGEQFYKVGPGNFITFAWNYTSLSVTPSAIDVMASCRANQATYTIAVNISAEQTKVVWDTENTPSGQAPFLTEKYTLLIMDSNADVTAAPRPGYLGVFNQFTFGMYTPQPYKNWTDFQCANCIKSGALSSSEKATLRVLLFTTGTTVASMLYFAHNFGLW